MSKFRSSVCKPPLADSLNRVGSCRILRSSANFIQTPSVSAFSMVPKPPTRRLSSVGETELRPEYRAISYEFQALAKMVKDEFGNNDLGNADFAKSFNFNSSPKFERGRFYAEYSARRNERLKRKKGETGEDKKPTVYSLGVNVESGKKRDSKKLDSLRKSVPANFTISRTESSRYSLRSSKENKKPIPMASYEMSAGVVGGRKIGTRSVCKR
ncbi:hypothetical protein GIB67_038257 [Kingdonia uniflora]|uniref:Uncharacterized protein n=1 Tax=Kingdonia uniflora TaxID=39325 RepID=A0A7J7MS73_9MAGN|nr:hypothetical protein GIB67_038257 [Kingdonia uniflora]